MVPPDELQPRFSRVVLADQVHRILRRHILAGRYRGGEALNTVVLAEELGVSRTPVRQALQALEHRGLVELDTRGQYVVHQPSEDEMVEVFLLRLTLEWLASATLARRTDAAALRGLERLLREQEDVLVDEDPMPFLERDGEFHVRLARSAGLAHAAEFLTELRDLIVLLGGRALARPGRRVEVLAEHRALVAALATGAPAAAARAAFRHLLNTAASLSADVARRLGEALAATPPFPPVDPAPPGSGPGSPP